MKYNVPILSKKSYKFLKKKKKEDSILYDRIIDKIKEIGNDPYSYEYLKDKPKYFKARVGNYRIIFAVKEDNIYILDVNHRRKIYKNLP